MKFLCPVCGYPEMEEPAERFAICSSCGTEFGNHDFVFDAQDYPAKLAELRAAWLAAGAPWFDDGMPRPANWDPFAQLMQDGLALVTTSSSSATEVETTRLRWNAPLVRAELKVA